MLWPARPAIIRAMASDPLAPEGEDLRRAVRYISERRQEEGAPSLLELVDEASLQFELSPRDQQFLINTFTHGD